MFSIIILLLLSTSLGYAFPANSMKREDELPSCPESATDILMGGKILKFQADRRKPLLLAFQADLAIIIKTSTMNIPMAPVSDEDIKKAKDTRIAAKKYWVGWKELDKYYTYKDFLPPKSEAVKSWKAKGCKDWELYLLQAVARVMYGDVQMLKPTWRSYPPATDSQKRRLLQLVKIAKQELQDPAGLVCHINWIWPNSDVTYFTRGACRGGFNARHYPYFPPKDKKPCPTSADEFKDQIQAPESKEEFLLKDLASQHLPGLKNGPKSVPVEDLINKDFLSQYLDPDPSGNPRMYCPWFWALANQAAARIATGVVNIAETALSPKIPSLGTSQTMPKAPSIFELLTFYELRKRHEVTSVFLTTVSRAFQVSPLNKPLIKAQPRVALQGNWQDGKASTKRPAPGVSENEGQDNKKIKGSST
ncbi:hypothetical protein MMC09_006169 [Bachmanniomyces sp. S44760]|nr:hypothetical protein [Bachmanniomyces sp. S44760]